MLTQIQHLLSDAYVPQSADDFIGPSRQVALTLDNLVAANRESRAPFRVLLNGPPGIGKSALARYLQFLLFAEPQSAEEKRGKGEKGQETGASLPSAPFLPCSFSQRCKWSTHKYSGVDVTVDSIRSLASKFHLRDMFSDWTLIWIEEADKIPPTAQVRFLMLLDEMPPGTAVIATSNCKLAEFESRFQTRFITPEPFIQPPSGEEVERYLLRLINGDDVSPSPWGEGVKPRGGHAPLRGRGEGGPQTDKAVHAASLRQISTFCCGNVRAALLDTLDLFLRPPAAVAA